MANSSTSPSDRLSTHRPDRGGGVPDVVKKVLAPFASLKLTVLLLVLTFVLIFAGTWAQIHMDIWEVQKEYFHSLVAWVPLKVFLPAEPLQGGGFMPWLVETLRPLGFPMPGGYTLIVLLLLNLLAAHTLRFKFVWGDLYLLVPLLAATVGVFWVWQSNPTPLLMALGLLLSAGFVAGLMWLHAKRSGVILIHLGLILLLVGEVVTSFYAVEARMHLSEGDISNFVADHRETELAFTDSSPEEHDRVVVVSQRLLQGSEPIRHEDVPVEVRVDHYFTNSILRDTNEPVTAEEKEHGLTDVEVAGRGAKWRIVPQPPVTGLDQHEDRPSAYVTLRAGGKNLGTYLLTTWFKTPEPVTVDGKLYQAELRFRRYYKPYTIQLIDFKHDRYLGTNTAKNFESRVRLVDPEHNVDRQVKIWMNHPLRYRGETFFQSGFEDDRTTILQVVDNPGWLLPYFSCTIVGAGMLVHFGITLLGFVRRNAKSWASVAAGVPPPLPGGGGQQSKKRPARETLMPKPPAWRRPGFVVPAVVTALCGLYVLSHLRPAPRPKADDFDYAGFGRIPVAFEGRTQPLDSLARNTLRVISGRSSIKHKIDADGDGEKDDTQKVPAVEWLLDVFADPDQAAQYKVFRIDHPQVKSVLELDSEEKLFSVDDIRPRMSVFIQQVGMLRGLDDKDFDPYQKALSTLGRKFNLYQQLAGVSLMVEYEAVLDARDDLLKELGSLTPEQRQQSPQWAQFVREATPVLEQLQRQPEAGGLHLAPPLSDEEKADGQWWTLRDILDARVQRGPGPTLEFNPFAATFLKLLDAYRTDRPESFNEGVQAYHKTMAKVLPAVGTKAGFETTFNRASPFVTTIPLYVLAFVLACVSWLKWPATLARTALWVMVLALVFHTLGLIGRIYISGRPPVTNLYSSAIFIAWGAVILAVGLEYFFRNGIGSATGSALGFLSLIIAHNLASDGDTMRVLQAVLDTNIWLATHVVVITLGYAATFLAGMLAIIYVIRGLFTEDLAREEGKALARMVYGIVCFAMLFSFVGTILGGIWADQSWGRFWGWDPKENGAALIVVWVAVILHARWGGIIRDRGLMLLAIFGNVVTAWSWFGTNMLGVGLHAYGFIDSAVFWLGLFIFSQLALIIAGMTPLKKWRSFAATA